MPTTTGTSIAAKARLVLQDPTAVRFDDAEVLGWINDAQVELVTYRPDASNASAVVTLAGGTKQALPAGGTHVLEVQRNIAADGTTPGEAVREISMQLMDSFKPTWHADTQASTIKHYMKDERTPRLFYVWPPAVAGTKVETVYCTPPTALSTLASTITVDDLYAPALLDYILFRCYAKETERDGSAARAAAHRQLFDAAVGKKLATDAGQGQASKE